MHSKIIGICGGIGSGKSVLSRVLRLRGEEVYDCDLEARRIMDSSEEVLEALSRRYGDAVCPAGGPICRPELGRRVFGDERERLWLNSLVHRLVRKDVSAWSGRMLKEGRSRCFVESAIMATSGLAAMCDAIIIVDAPDSLRIARVMRRDGLDEDDVRRRIASQMEEERLLRQSGCRILSFNNDGNASLLQFLEGIL